MTKNPLDLRGSRLALEGAKIFLELENMKENVSFLQTSLSVPKPRGETTNGERTVCPTIACDWIASKTLKFLRKLNPYFLLILLMNKYSQYSLITNKTRNIAEFSLFFLG